MEIFGVDLDGGMFKINIQRATQNASELLGGILPPIPRFLGKLGENCGMFVNGNESTIVAFIMDELELRTRFLIKGESIKERYITTGWESGVMSKKTWSPPEGYKIILLVEAHQNGSISQKLSIVNSRKSYAAPVRNVFRDGLICTGVDLEFMQHTDNGRSIHKILDAPRFLADSIWNGDAGSITESDYEWMFRWDLEGNQIVPSPDKFQKALVGEDVIPEFIRSKMRGIRND